MIFPCGAAALPVRRLPLLPKRHIWLQPPPPLQEVQSEALFSETPAANPPPDTPYPEELFLFLKHDLANHPHKYPRRFPPSGWLPHQNTIFR